MGEKRKRSTSPFVVGLDLFSRIPLCLGNALMILCQAGIGSNEVQDDECESKKIKAHTTLEEPHTPQPLTEENLRLLQGLPAMSQPKEGKDEDDSAKTLSTKVSIETRELLRINQLLMDDKEAFDRYPSIKAKWEELITQERHTGMTEEEQDNILNELPLMMKVNEETFIELLWPALIRDVRHKETNGAGSIVEQSEAPVLTTWKEDHLARVRKQMFDSNSMPSLDPGNNKVLKALLLTVPKLVTPKPDYCFGLLEEAFTRDEQEVNDRLRQYTLLSKPLYHCFFAVEFKTMDGEWSQCQTQCCRAGAAMVYATEQLLKVASPANEHALKDDHLRKEPCMAFTLAVNPKFSELNLHWAEPSGTSTIYHMHKVRDYVMARGGELKNLRHDIDCILDWGCVDRKTSIRETLAKIIAKHDSMPAPSLSTPSKGGEKSATDESREHVKEAGDASEA